MREFLIKYADSTQDGVVLLPEDAKPVNIYPDEGSSWRVYYLVPVYEQPDTGHPSDLYENPEGSLLEHAYKSDDIKRRFLDFPVISEERDLAGVPITFIEEGGF